MLKRLELKALPCGTPFGIFVISELPGSMTTWNFQPWRNSIIKIRRFPRNPHWYNVFNIRDVQVVLKAFFKSKDITVASCLLMNVLWSPALNTMLIGGLCAAADDLKSTAAFCWSSSHYFTHTAVQWNRAVICGWFVIFSWFQKRNNTVLFPLLRDFSYCPYLVE